jgi:hypothetical protein
MTELCGLPDKLLRSTSDAPQRAAPMTIQWLLIVITSARLYIPIMAYDTQTECTAALEAMQTVPSVSRDCVLVTIEPPPPPRRRRRRN